MLKKHRILNSHFCPTYRYYKLMEITRVGKLEYLSVCPSFAGVTVNESKFRMRHRKKIRKGNENERLPLTISKLI